MHDGPTADADKERLEKMGLGLVSSLDGDVALASDSELACRFALVRMLDAEMGPSDPNTPLEFIKAAAVREAIGDNRNASVFARTFGLSRSESAAKLILSGRASETMQRLAKKWRKHVP